MTLPDPGETEATQTEFEYDDMYRRASAACTTSTGIALSVSYEYTDDYLTTIRGDKGTVLLSHFRLTLRKQ